MSTARVDFTRAAAERIASVVRTVERGDRDESALRFGKPLPDAPGKVFRMCTYTGAWDKGTTATVTFLNQTTTPNTVVARNLFADIDASAFTAHCAIAREGTAWYLIAAECS